MKGKYFCYALFTSEYLKSKGHQPENEGNNISNNAPYTVYRWTDELESDLWKAIDLSNKFNYYHTDNRAVYCWLTEENGIEPTASLQAEGLKPLYIYHKDDILKTALHEWKEGWVDKSKFYILYSDKVRQFLESQGVLPLETRVSNWKNVPIYIYEKNNELSKSLVKYKYIKN